MISLLPLSYSSDYICFGGRLLFSGKARFLIWVWFLSYINGHYRIEWTEFHIIPNSYHPSDSVFCSDCKVSSCPRRLLYNFEKGYYPRLKLFQGSSITFVMPLLPFLFR